MDVRGKLRARVYTGIRTFLLNPPFRPILTPFYYPFSGQTLSVHSLYYYLCMSFHFVHELPVVEKEDGGGWFPRFPGSYGITTHVCVG